MPKRNYDDTGERFVGGNAKIEPVEENATSTERQTTSLLDLNVYCLLELFKKLQLKDKLHCAVTCRGLLNFYSVEIVPKYKKFCADVIKTISQMDQTELRIFLEATAPFVEEVYISQLELVAGFVEQLFRYGVNIKQVDIKMLYDYEKHNLAILLTNMQCVENLYVFGNVPQDDDLKEIKQLPYLRRLAVDCPITGKYFATFCNLEELFLDSPHLKPKYVQEIAKCCTKLRLLHVALFKMDVETSQVIAQHCQRLETLGFETRPYSSEDLSALAKLPQMRRLCIIDPNVPFLAALAENKAAQLDDARIVCKDLQCLETKVLTYMKNLKMLCLKADYIDFETLERCSFKNLEKLAIIYCNTLRDNMLLKILKGCINLKKIAVISCAYISKNAAFACVDVLRERWAGTSCKPFVFFEGVQTNRNSILKDERFPNASAILKLEGLEMGYEGCYFHKKGNIFEP